ncbi:hypothetical protein SPFL3101_02850 [Sporomusaceae bacterium FL31]|nr:hypothetical protein SPFL3101_02850 [Sporomusaceae bacterium FL31]
MSEYFDASTQLQVVALDALSEDFSRQMFILLGMSDQ